MHCVISTNAASVWSHRKAKHIAKQIVNSAELAAMDDTGGLGSSTSGAGGLGDKAIYHGMAPSKVRS